MEKELLKYALDNGIIDLSYIQEQCDMKKRKDIIKSHPYSIWRGKDGNWYTYLPKQDGGRRLVKRKDEKSIHQAIIDYHEKIDTNKFSKRFEIWMDRQSACGRSDNTIYKYETDYKRFFKGDPIEEMDIRYITDEQLCLFIARLLERKNVPWRALKGMFGYINGVFEKAIIDGIIEKNPCKHVDLPIYRKKCVEPRKKSNEERTVSGKEKKILLDKFEKYDIIEKYAVQLNFLVGMRVGEIVALKWEDVDFRNETITICRSEKFNKKTKIYTIESTKTGKSRVIPMTDNIKKVLFAVRDYEIKRGNLGEFVFMNESGRLHTVKLSQSIYNKTRTRDFSSTKSIHAIRRTLNSNMRCNGVSPTVAAAILGHSEMVNERNYTYDTSSLDEKRKILNNASNI